MKPRFSTFVLLSVAAVMFIAGCGGAGSGPNPPDPAITVALSPQPPSSIDTAATTSLTAAVGNDSANGGVKWSVSCGSAQCGTFSASSAASGQAVNYTAPATTPSPANVKVTATSVSDATKSASATINISAPSAPVSVTLNPAPPSSLSGGASANLTAVVSNDSANAGVKWTVSCGSSQCGSFNPTATPSGTATSYTAPATPPTPATVTVTATSVTDSTKSASASISITAPSPVLADASYVFHLAGQDATGYYYIAGAFTVQNGVITGGEQDMVDDDGNYQDSIVASGSSLSLVSGNIQVVLKTGDSNVGVNGAETLRGNTVSNERVLISEFDTFATATGSIDQQTSTAAPAGGYAFNLGGFDGLTPQNTFVIGGILNINSTAISVSNSVFDYNDGGSPAQKQTFTSGTVSAPDSYGRVVLTLNPSGSSGVPSFAVAGYTVGTNQIQLVETQDTLGGDLGGTALGQGSNTGQFTQAAIGGSTYVFGAIGQDGFSQNSTIAQMAGGFGLNADGTVSGDIALNDLTLHIGSQITSGTYTVDPTGRVTLNVTTMSGSLPNPLSFTFQLYLDGNGNALELGVDDSQATFGLAYLQTAPSADFEGSYALNAFGIGNFGTAPAWSAIGPATVASDAFSGYTDYSVQDSTSLNPTSIVTADVPLTGSESSSTGQLSLTGLNAQNPQGSTPSGFGYYPIDNRRVIAIELDSQQTGLMMLEGTQPN
jgi:hypothetical protein